MDHSGREDGGACGAEVVPVRPSRAVMRGGECIGDGLLKSAYNVFPL
jgi:hypothetical protein